MTATSVLCRCAMFGVKTLRTQDTSDPRHFGTGAEVSVRHFGTSAELSGHIGTSAKVSYGHFGTEEDIAGFAAPGNTGNLFLYSDL